MGLAYLPENQSFFPPIESMHCETPILFCIFNRPLETQRVFDCIAQMQPARLFVIADGPRPDRNGEKELVAQTRAVIDQIDWPCELTVNFADENMGCKHRMATGITWAFQHTDRLIILEDDCLPHPGFFGYCDDLLDRYADDARVMMISGDDFQSNPVTGDSYYFSRWTHIWGWATWRRAWQHFDVEMRDWPTIRDNGSVSAWCDDPREVDHWTQVLNQQHAGNIDTWDFPWMVACWRRGGLTILPQRNLVTNIGFGDAATHTMDVDSPLANMPVHSPGPMRHPVEVKRHIAADYYTLENVMLPPRNAETAGTPDQRQRRNCCNASRLSRSIHQFIRTPHRKFAALLGWGRGSTKNAGAPPPRSNDSTPIAKDSA